MAVSANRLELLQIADAVAREKSIDRSIVIAAMEDAIQKAARSRYGSETEVRAEINPKTGEMRLSRLLLVADQVENDAIQISVEDARRRNPAARVGDYIAEPLPPLEYGRIAAQSAKQVIVQKVREAERDRQYQEFKDRIGDIVNGIVKRVEYGNVVADLGRGEAIVRRDELLPRELFRTETASAPIFTMCGASRAVRRFSSRARIRNSWPSFSPRRCRKSTTVSSRSRRWRATQAHGPRSQSSRGIPRSIRLAPASACAGRACRRWLTSCKAKRSTSSRGRRTWRPSWSTRWRRPKSPRWCSTKTASASRSWFRISSFRSPSEGAARTCGSPPSLPDGTSTSSPSRKNRNAGKPNSRSAPRY